MVRGCCCCRHIRIWVCTQLTGQENGRPALQKNIGGFCCVFLAGKAQWGGSTFGTGVNVGAGIQEQFDYICGVGIGGIVERASTCFRSGGVGVGPPP
jgi:hypothetical protein